jgi:hypothetical protein
MKLCQMAVILKAFLNRQAKAEHVSLYFIDNYLHSKLNAYSKKHL